MYSATGSLRTYTDRALHVGQVLSTDYNMFDCLLTLCDLCQDLPSLLRDLWQLLMLMLLPIQADLQTCCRDQWSGRPSSNSIINSTWTQILQSSLWIKILVQQLTTGAAQCHLAQ